MTEKYFPLFVLMSFEVYKCFSITKVNEVTCILPSMENIWVLEGRGNRRVEKIT